MAFGTGIIQSGIRIRNAKSCLNSIIMDGIQLRLKTNPENILHLPWKVESLLEGGEVGRLASSTISYRTPKERVRYNHTTKELVWSGSLQKVIKPDNRSGFTFREFRESVGTLADILNCKPADLAVINAEISATIQQSPVHHLLNTFKNRPFLPMVKKGTPKVYGAICLREQYGAKVYDKTLAEHLYPSVIRANVPDNITQVEFLVRRKEFYNGNGFNLSGSVTLADLLKPEVYRNSYNLLINMTKELQFDNAVDWGYLEKKHGLKPADTNKVQAIHDTNRAAQLKQDHPHLYKQYMKLYNQVKCSLSADAGSTSEQFQRAVLEAVQQKYDG